ncbi:MAG: PorT family protein [Prolixibacteraceae bacterium]|nr:PorT family protein [Prolixibacteraceae bacterium]
MNIKKTLVLTLTLFLGYFVYSQKQFEPETYLGIKFGGNISGIYSDPFINQKINAGITSGLVFQHISEKNLGVQLELNYKQTGWNENLDSTNIYTRQFNIVELPFMTHVKIGNQKTRFIVNIGPYLSYLLSENESLNLLHETEEIEYYGIKIDNKANIGLCLGLGMSRQTSIGLFQMESRISSSINDMFSRNSVFPFSSSKSLNAELSLLYVIEI